MIVSVIWIMIVFTVLLPVFLSTVLGQDDDLRPNVAPDNRPGVVDPVPTDRGPKFFPIPIFRRERIPTFGCQCSDFMWRRRNGIIVRNVLNSIIRSNVNNKGT